MLKKAIWSAIIIGGILIVWNWSLIYYGIRQGIGQFEIIWNARPVEEFMEDPSFPDSLKSKLKLIEDVRKFAIDSLGLKDTENYKTLYDQKNKEVMWVVQACEPFALVPKQWHFPIVGSVPYKGFFNKAKALDLRKELEEEGYDVSVRNPGGWSTLGWFTDPILSGMLDRTDTAAYDFLRYRFGRESKEYMTYLHQDQDYRKYTKHILRGTRSLDSLYQTMQQSDAFDKKKRQKDAMISKIISAIDTLHLYEKRNSAALKKKLPNNTFFMSYRLYKSKQNIFEEELDKKFKGDIRAYVLYLSNQYPFL